MTNHAEQIGNLQPLVLPPTLPSFELRLLLEQHKAARPDHQVCLHPDAPPAMRALFVAWRDRKEKLETQLGIAVATEKNVWRDVTNQRPVQPAPWGGGLSDLRRMQGMQNRKRAHEREAAEAKLLKRKSRPIASPAPTPNPEPVPTMEAAPEPQAPAVPNTPSRGGRPRVTHPSRETFQRRHQRNRLRELQG